MRLRSQALPLKKDAAALIIDRAGAYVANQVLKAIDIADVDDRLKKTFRRFQNQLGVYLEESPETSNRRRYRMLRVPRHVLNRYNR